MDTRLILNNRRSQITEKNFYQSMDKIRAALTPGTPVMLLQFRKNNQVFGGGRHAQAILFFSDGSLSREGKFGVQGGKRNFVYASLNESNPLNYSLLTNTNPGVLRPEITLPYSGTRNHFNEGTFSPAGGTSWQSSYSGGTEEVIVGRPLGTDPAFQEALTAINFAKDAIQFDLHQAYSWPSYLIHEKGDTLDGKGPESVRDDITRRMARVRACINLLQHARRKTFTNPDLIPQKDLEGIGDTFAAYQVGWFHEGVKNLREAGLPVCETDYIIRDTSHSERKIAFVKVGGGTYILPADKRAEGLVDLAFSEPIVRSLYPYGLKK